MRFILLLFCLLASLAARAQVDSVAQSASRKPLPMFGDKSLSLGLNTQFLFEGIFEGEISTPFEILFRKRVGKSGAIRLRTWGLVQTSNRTQPYGNTFERVTDLGIAAGKEWHRAINHKWGYYYGAELGFASTTSVVDSAMAPFVDMNELNIYQTRKTSEKINQLELQSFTGGYFNLGKGIAISAEIGLLFTYSKNDSKREVFQWIEIDSNLLQNGLPGTSHILTNELKIRYAFFPKIFLTFNL